MSPARHRGFEAADDDELVRRFQAGDDREQAFMTLFERHGPITYGFLRRRIGDPDVAAELNQELFLNALCGLDRFRGESSFRTWLFRLAYNQLSNLRRRWRTHLDERPDAPVPEELAAEVLVALDDTPDSLVERGQRDDLLDRCLAGLPEIERAVIVGQYYEGATLEELTRRYNLTNPSGARASLIAAQRKLRRCIEAAGLGPDARRPKAREGGRPPRGGTR
jgi:RNA polymerase sigma-70 factor (ECF subfamily)